MGFNVISAHFCEFCVVCVTLKNSEGSNINPVFNFDLIVTVKTL